MHLESTVLLYEVFLFILYYYISFAFFAACSFATSTFSDLSVYTHFIKFPPGTQEFKPSILLWNLGDFKNATIRIAFSALPLPLSGKTLREMNAGIELTISPFKVNFTAKDTEVTYICHNSNYSCVIMPNYNEYKLFNYKLMIKSLKQNLEEI